jgi:hypothetical protein
VVRIVINLDVVICLANKSEQQRRSEFGRAQIDANAAAIAIKEPRK